MYPALQWAKAEKQVARKALDAAFERECRAIRAKVEQMLERQEDMREIWRIHDYLSTERGEIDQKYDYRYSKLTVVFGILLREGWRTEAELSGLGHDKTERIKAHSSF